MLKHYRQWICAMLLLPVSGIVSAQTVQTGSVRDAQTGAPLGGASIRVVNTTRGTYTRSNGTFRLPLDPGMTVLTVRSIGYADTTIPAQPGKDLAIALTPTGVTKNVVQVTADIEPMEVVRRAIARAKENDQRLTTLISTTYSKMKVVLDVPNMGQEQQPRESITETISKVYYRRYPEREKRVHIEQRRQTRNIPAANNLGVFDDFLDITRPELRIMNTRLITPLGEGAPDMYTYRIVNRKAMGKALVYELEFEPRSRLFPGFEGTLSIIDSSYQTIAAEFTTTAETAFPFVKRLKYSQKYEQADNGIWVPMYQNISGEASVAVITGLAEFKGKLSIEAYVTNAEANVPIADSLLRPPSDTTVRGVTAQTSGVTIRTRGRAKHVTVANDADSSRPDFWDNHAYAEMSDEEKEAYRAADSIIANRTPRSGDTKERIGLVDIGPVGMNVLPLLTRTTITGWAFGGELEFVYTPVSLTLTGLWGQNNTVAGNIGLQSTLFSGDVADASLFGNVFSTYATIQPQRSILGKPGWMNVNDLLFMEYQDYYRKEGWNAGIHVATGRMKAALTAEVARNVNNTIVAPTHREQLLADAGNYQTLRLEMQLNKQSFLEEFFGDERWISGTLGAIVGRETVSNRQFATASASMSLRLATFSTGYKPMFFNADVTYGTVLTDWAPLQYQFSLLRRYPALSTLTELATVSVNRYGGHTALVFHAEHNFTDIWWRALGIPTFSNARGIDLIAVYGAGITRGSRQTDMVTVWQNTTTPYMEAGFALARIPTFISDLAHLRFDAMWPVGGLGNTGTFGWSVTLSSPLF